MPRDRVGLAIGKDRQGYYPAVVAMSTEINPTNMRNLAYLIGREIGNYLTPEEQAQLQIQFKGKQVYYLSEPVLVRTWKDFHNNRVMSREPIYYLYQQGNVRKAESIAMEIAAYIRLPEPQVVPIRDPDLPDNVFISANVPL